MAAKLLVDEMMGRLARWLRAAGYDAEHQNPWPDCALLARARETGAPILTRDRKLARLAGPDGLVVLRIESEDVFYQVREVAQAFRLDLLARAFTRCVECNAPVERIEREVARFLVPKLAFERHAEFHRCPRCGKVFW